MKLFRTRMKSHWKKKYAKGFKGHEPDSAQVEVELKKALVPGTVLEVGAGIGYFSDLMREWGYDVTQTDLVMGNQLDITREARGEFDNVVAIGVMHHIIDRDKFNTGLANIAAMAKQRVVLGVKLPSVRFKTRTRHSYRYSAMDYTDVLGSPVKVTACGYLSLLEWEVGTSA
ncbi:MAG: class I SAM-dependent methyltransferase [Gammaproteobacteria bacterium]|nr:class I SAM-dependent methyltransferase [Gammaproteobacteria bacterium]MDH3749174.1 class I SAM-dependent methyltransferase [Gammaproteobacteria bacterium]MDH3806568.1 class I SAM-dependent methyltransferase [Gammaproteobacteria bacterium]